MPISDGTLARLTIVGLVLLVLLMAVLLKWGFHPAKVISFAIAVTTAVLMPGAFRVDWAFGVVVAVLGIVAYLGATAVFARWIEEARREQAQANSK